MISLHQENAVATLTLDAPDRQNAFVGGMRRELAMQLEHLAHEASVRVIVLTGAGENFCAGNDAETLLEVMDSRDPDDAARMQGAARRIVTNLREINKPIVAAIRGTAAGAGWGLALACDWRIASETARFSQPAVKMGLFPEWGAPFFLARMLPPNLAFEIFTSGEEITAEEAYHRGLVNQVVPDAELEAATQELAGRLVRTPPEAVAAIKQAVYMAGTTTFDGMLEFEAEAQMNLFKTPIARRAVRAAVDRSAAEE